MNPQLKPLLVRCIAIKENQQWVAVCLPYALCVQADDLVVAKKLLHDQISAYLYDACSGQDQAHQDTLMHRPAPLKYWLLYALCVVLNGFRLRHNQINRFTESMPAVPMAC
jgi:hypothetical protein